MSGCREDTISLWSVLVLVSLSTIFRVTIGVQETVLPEPVILLQEEEALLSEMDVTGQAFEDMQEQNIRLMQQLREKDDANFKLMSERIKSNQIHKLLKEEKEELADQVLTLKTQVTWEKWRGQPNSQEGGGVVG